MCKDTVESPSYARKVLQGSRGYGEAMLAQNKPNLSKKEYSGVV